MAKFKLFSDIHIWPWTGFAEINEKGVNTRLVEIVSLLKGIIKSAHEENCDGILFSGDLFNVPRVDATTMDLTVRALRESEIPIVMIPGNHDEASKMLSFHSLRGFHGLRNCIVLDRREGQRTKIAGSKIAGIPFTASPKRLLASLDDAGDSDILLCHTGFAGATAGFDFIADQKNFVQVPSMGLGKRHIGLTVAGHFHQPQLWHEATGRFFKPEDHENTYYLKGAGSLLVPGAPTHHNFGDVGSVRGSWTYRTDKKVLDFQRLVYPSFVKTKYSDAIGRNAFSKMTRGNYVHCVVRSEEDWKAAEEILSMSARGYDLILKRKEKTERKVTVKLGMSYKKVFKRYIKQEIPEGHTVEGLMKTGLALIREAEAT